MIARVVQPELLDSLLVDDELARTSRLDLRRVNDWMGNATIIARSMGSIAPARRIVELGAGDGSLLLKVAQQLSPRWHNVEALLVDQQRLLSPDIAAQFHSVGWNVRAVEEDVFDWLLSNADGNADVIIANLFLHHFTTEPLRRLLGLAATRTQCFVACEPARTLWTMAAVRLLPLLIGCNSVTRHDATISVRAGFTGTELSELWPATNGWELGEQSANAFTHCFEARRTT